MINMKKDLNLVSMRVFVKDEFNKFIKEFNPEYPIKLFIPSGIEYVKHIWNCSASKYITDAEFFVNILESNDLYDKSFMHSVYDFSGGRCDYVVFVPEHHLLEVCYNHLFHKSNVDINDIYEYLSMAIKHEIGHLIYAQSLVKSMGYEEAGKILLEYNSSKALEAYSDFYNNASHEFMFGHYDNDKDEDEAFKHFICDTMAEYYKLPEESQANRIANIDVDRFIELGYKVVYQYAEF